MLKEPYKTLIEKLLAYLKEAFRENLVSVVLYGSLARGEAREDSDIDLLIVCRDLPRERFKRQELFLDAEKKLDDELLKLYEKGYYPIFSSILKTKREAENFSPLYLDMCEDAIILYDKDDFFKKILEKLKVELKKLGAKRIYIGKKWYWDLKPDYKIGDVIKIG